MTFCFLKRSVASENCNNPTWHWVMLISLPRNWVFIISDSLTHCLYDHTNTVPSSFWFMRSAVPTWPATVPLRNQFPATAQRERGKEVEKRSQKVAIMLQHKCLFITDCFTRSSSTNCQSLLFVIVLSLCCYAVAPVIPFQSPARTHNSTSPPVPPLCLPLLAPNSTNKVTFFLYLANYFLLIGYSSWNRNP